jgi:hypothetical protein
MYTKHRPPYGGLLGSLNSISAPLEKSKKKQAFASPGDVAFCLFIISMGIEIEFTVASPTHRIWEPNTEIATPSTRREESIE